MIWSATAAAAGPVIASLIGDHHPGSERGRVYGHILFCARRTYPGDVAAAGDTRTR